MANDKKERTAEGLYEGLKNLSNETGLDFGIDDYSLGDFKSKYFSSQEGVGNLYDVLSGISDESGLDFGIGSRDEWVSSFGGGDVASGEQKPAGGGSVRFDMRADENRVDENGVSGKARKEREGLYPWGEPGREQAVNQKAVSQKVMGAQSEAKTARDGLYTGSAQVDGRMLNYFRDVAPKEQAAEVSERQRKESRAAYDAENFESFYQGNVKPVFDAERAKGDERGEAAASAYRGRLESALRSTTPGAQMGVAMLAQAAREREIDPAKIADNAVKAVEQSKVDDYVLGRMGFRDDGGAEGDVESAPLSDVEKMMFNELYGREIGEVADLMMQRMYQEYQEAGMPKGDLEYIFGKALHDNMVSTLTKAVINRMAGSSGLREQFRAQAYEKYGEDAGWWTRMAGSAAPFAVDVATGGFYLPSLAGEGAVKGVTELLVGNVAKNISKRAAGAITEEAARRLATNAVSRYLSTNAGGMNILMRTLGSSANFGTYEAQSEMIRQFNYGEFDPAEIGKAALHGAALGGVMGAAGSGIGTLARGAGMAGRAAGYIGGIAAETGIFAADKAIEQAQRDGVSIVDVDWASIIGESLAMVGGMKSVGGISGLAGVLAEGKPLKETIRNRFMRSSDYDLRLNERDVKELRDAGYDFRNFFKGMDELTEMVPLAKELEMSDYESRRSKIRQESNSPIEVDAEGILGLLKSPDVSSETKRKIFYLATGKVLSPEGVFHSEMEIEEDGSATVYTYNINGKIAGVKEFEDVRDADQFMRESQSQAKTNALDLMLHTFGFAEEVESHALEMTKERYGVNVEEVLRKRKEERTEAEQAVVSDFSRNWEQLATNILSSIKLQAAAEEGIEEGRKLITAEGIHENEQGIQSAEEGLLNMKGGETIKARIDDLFSQGASTGELSNLLTGLNPEEAEVAERYMSAKARDKGLDLQVNDKVTAAVEAERRRLEPFTIMSTAYGEPCLVPVTYKGREGYVVEESADGQYVTVKFADADADEAEMMFKADDADLEMGVVETFDGYMQNYQEQVSSRMSAQVEGARVNNPRTKVEPVVGDVIDTKDGQQRVALVTDDWRVLLEPDEYRIDEETGRQVAVHRGRFTGADLMSWEDFVGRQNAYWDEVDRTSRENREAPTMDEEDGDGVALQQNGQGEEVKPVGRSLSEDEADDLILETIERAKVMPVLELTPGNWKSEFGDGVLSTPLGDVKIGENQYEKLLEKGREKEFGMIKPTLTDPDFVIEESSTAKEGQETERPSSYLFVKAFIGKDGKKHYFFKSVTVEKDGMEVNVSNHLERPKRVRESLKNGKLLYRFNGGAQTEQTPASVSGTTSLTNQGVESETKGSEADATRLYQSIFGNEDGNLVPQNSASDGKGTESSDNIQTNEEKNADDELVEKLVGMDESRSAGFVKNNLDKIDGDLRNARKKVSKATDFDVFERETAEFEAEVKRLEAEKSRWEDIQRRVREGRIAAIGEAAESAKMDKKVRDLGEPLSLREWVMRSLYDGGYKFVWGDSDENATRGLGSHLGLSGSSAEQRRRLWMLASREKGGLYPEEVAERMLSSYAADMGWEGTEGDWGVTSRDVLDVLLDVVMSHDTRSKMGQGAVEAHQGGEAAVRMGANEDEEAYLKDEWAKDMFFSSYDEYEDYVEMIKGEVEPLPKEDFERNLNSAAL